ncbi:MAG: substrate-binding domain-containing protein [Magnetospirillum sp.]|nr:substrate-binding domain-containing protein [Magnetospirillum sp.]
MRTSLIALAVVAALGLRARTAHAEEVLIIVNPSVEATDLTRSQISAIYLLKTTVWPDGQRIVPVNREATSGTRAEFTADVLREDNATLATYWNEMHFKGRMPPLIQESDQAVLAFIQKVPGSIGYIRASTAHPDVKVLGRVP